MKEYKSRTSRRQEEEKNNNTKKKIMMIILLIIMLLSLITSCSCTSNFFGKLGSLFENLGKHEIDDKPSHPEIIKNRELKFDKDSLEISVSDSKTKLGFSYTNISPKEFTCSTDDASIATCYVIDGYIVINPYKPGSVTVTLQTETNGKIYQATAQIKINDSDSYISLSSYAGTINLAYGKNRTITYSLVGLSGNVTVSSSDESVAEVTLKDGVIKIVGKKVGKATITVSLEANGKTYTAEYELNVINDKNAGSGNSKPNDQGSGKKDNISTLSNITTNQGTLTPSFSSNILEYNIGVSWWTWNITLKATATNSNVQKNITYSYKRADKENYETVNSLDNLSLKVGDNIALITVTAEDGSKTVYKVVINRAFGDYLDSLTPSTGTLTPTFDKHTTGYTMEVPATTNTLSFEAKAHDKDSIISYTFNGVTRDNLNDLYLVTGPNVVTITVKNNGTERTYQVIINKLSSSGVIDNALLTSLVLDGKDQLNFSPFKKNYSIGVDYGVTSTLLSASASSPTAKITIFYKGNSVTGGNVASLNLNNLEVGDNKVTVTVVNGKETEEYTLNINRASNPYTEGGSNTLDEIKITSGNGTLVPEFTNNTTEYEVNVDENTSSMSFQVFAGNGTKVSYSYNNGNWIESKNININNLNPGKNTLVIRATDGSGNSRDYTIVINRDTGSQVPTDVSLQSVTVDGKPIEKYLDDKTYKVDVSADKDSVKVKANPTNVDANITYTYNGIPLVKNPDGSVSVKDLQPGSNVVTVTVTVGDKSESYDVIINKESPLSNIATLDEFKIGGTSVLNGGTAEFREDETVSVSVKKTDEQSTVEYFFNGSAVTLSELNSAINNLTPGASASVSVKVTSQDKTVTKTYSATVKKNKKEDPIPPEPEKKITIEAYGKELTSVNGYYNTEVEYGITAIPIKVNVPDGSSVDSYRLCNADNTICGEPTADMSTLQLQDGWNILEISATENGVEKKLFVRIYKPTRILDLETANTTCEVGGANCLVTYVVKEIKSDGAEVTLDTSDTDAYSNVSIVIEPNMPFTTNGNVIALNPTLPGDYKVKVTKDGYKGAELSIKVTAKYDLSVKEPEGGYRVKINNSGTAFEDIIVNTSIFKANSIENKKVTGTNSLNICSTNKIACLSVTVTENADLISSLEYDPDSETAPQDLPIKVKGKNSGTATITFEAVVNGVTVKTTSVTVTLVKIREVKFYANRVISGGKTYEGLFYEQTEGETVKNVIEIPREIEEGQELLISDIIEPYAPSDDKCKFFKFAGYSTNKDAKPEDVLKIDKLEYASTDLNLYAIYSTVATDIDLDADIKDKVLWLEDVPIFGKKSTIDGKEVDNLIYPGAEGSYTAQIENKTKETIYLTGITIDETSTICVSQGCLNMGYVVRATDPDDEKSYYHYLKNNDITNSRQKYSDDAFKILNDGTKGGSVSVNFRTLGTNEDKLENDRVGKMIKIESGEMKEITIFWKWVESPSTDALDTEIGKKVDVNSESINRKYSIQVGIEYAIYNNECIKN